MVRGLAITSDMVRHLRLRVEEAVGERNLRDERWFVPAWLCAGGRAHGVLQAQGAIIDARLGGLQCDEGGCMGRLGFVHSQIPGGT